MPIAIDRPCIACWLPIEILLIVQAYTMDILLEAFGSPIDIAAYAYGSLWIWWPMHMVAYAYGGLWIWWPMDMGAYGYGGLWIWWPVDMVAYGYGGLSIWWSIVDSQPKNIDWISLW